MTSIAPAIAWKRQWAFSLGPSQAISRVLRVGVVRGAKGRRLLPHDLFEALLPRLHVFSVELEIVDGGPGQLFGGIEVHLLENGRPAVDDDLGTDSAAHLLYGD